MNYLKKSFKEQDVRYFFFLIFTPLLFSAITEFIILMSFRAFVNLTSAIVFLYIITNFFSVFPKIRKPLAVISTIFVYIPCLISLLFVITYKSEFCQDIVNAILNTNPSEATELLKEKTSSLNLSIIIGFIFNAVFCLKEIFKANGATSELYSKKHSIIAILLLLAYIALPKNFKTRPFYAISSYIVWTHHQKYINQFFNNVHNIKNPFQNVTINSNAQKQTFIIVIGESVDRKHMGIYGYTFNDTTPFFNKLKNELYIFKDITACAIWTYDVVSKIFVFENFQNGDLISLLKASGFKTFWISNHYYQTGMYDVPSTFLSQRCDSLKYLRDNERINFFKHTIDGDLIPHIKNAINDPANKKVIFVHLLGSHHSYHNRYPKTFKEFPIHDINYSKEKAKLVAEYDTSIRYTDYVLNEILTMLKEQNTYSAMLYMADHGEDVYDTKESICGRSTNITRHLTDVPFIVWVSDKYREAHADFINQWNLSKPYHSADFSHSVSDLLRISHNKFIPSKSIFR